MLYEAVENVELRDRPGAPLEERVLGTVASEEAAIELCREARQAFVEAGRHDYGWWIVREPGMTLARWIADSSTSKEFVLDLRSGELVEY
ncbi:MAG TPA: hypothetical protein VLB67_14805 [Acidimicrobiia bacterium]|nr:hypothetical protein [Acidimicrobiia bacterium]